MARSDPPGLDHLEPPAPLQASEIADAQALVAEAGWNQTAEDWRVFLDYGQVQAIRAENRVVATAATLPYGAFGWISMVLVTEKFRRQGFASRLMRGAIDALLAAGTVPVLDATPAGREVYRQLGFEDTWGFARLARSGAPPPPAAAPPAGITVAPITDADWPSLCAYDTAAFGGDRSPLLARLRGRLRPAELVVRRDGRLTGFLLGRDGRIASQLGPLIAEDAETARTLLTHALAAIEGPIFVDLADSKTVARAFLEAQDFVPARPLTRMVYRRRAAFDDGTRTFAVVGPEFG
jgi:GNAT superfamily N-acetyltransferase